MKWNNWKDARLPPGCFSPSKNTLIYFFQKRFDEKSQFYSHSSSNWLLFPNLTFSKFSRRNPKICSKKNFSNYHLPFAIILTYSAQNAGGKRIIGTLPPSLSPTSTPKHTLCQISIQIKFRMDNKKIYEGFLYIIDWRNVG